MPNSTAITILDYASSAKTISTVDAMLTAPSSSAPGSNVLTVQPSTNPFYVTAALSSAPAISSGSVVIASGTVTLSSVVSGTVNLIPAIQGGLTISSVVLSTTANETLVKSTTGQIYHLEGYNGSSSPAYVKLYNLSSTPTAGTSTVTLTWPIVPNTSAYAGFSGQAYEGGVSFSVGIGYAVTANITSTSTLAIPSPDTVALNVYYK